jgi:hypothetical protein
MAVKKAPETTEEIRIRVSQAVAMNAELHGVDLRVFLYLSERLNFHEPVHVAQLELITMLVRRKEHISRAIRTLVEAGILIPGPKGTRSSEWMLNPDYGK